MTLRDIRDALLSVIPNTYHFRAEKQKGPFIVWGETGPANSAYADDMTQIQVMNIDVDYFTPHEFDPNFTVLQNLFNGLELAAWQLNFIRYEDAVYEEGQNQIHYNWTLEAVLWIAEG